MRILKLLREVGVYLVGLPYGLFLHFALFFAGLVGVERAERGVVGSRWARVRGKIFLVSGDGVLVVLPVAVCVGDLLHCVKFRVIVCVFEREYLIEHVYCSIIVFCADVCMSDVLIIESGELCRVALVEQLVGIIKRPVVFLALGVVVERQTVECGIARRFLHTVLRHFERFVEVARKEQVGSIGGELVFFHIGQADLVEVFDSLLYLAGAVAHFRRDEVDRVIGYVLVQLLQCIDRRLGARLNHQVGIAAIALRVGLVHVHCLLEHLRRLAAVIVVYGYVAKQDVCLAVAFVLRDCIVGILCCLFRVFDSEVLASDGGEHHCILLKRLRNLGNTLVGIGCVRLQDVLHFLYGRFAVELCRCGNADYRQQGSR